MGINADEIAKEINPEDIEVGVFTYKKIGILGYLLLF